MFNISTAIDRILYLFTLKSGTSNRHSSFSDTEIRRSSVIEGDIYENGDTDSGLSLCAVELALKSERRIPY